MQKKNLKLIFILSLLALALSIFVISDQTINNPNIVQIYGKYGSITNYFYPYKYCNGIAYLDPSEEALVDYGTGCVHPSEALNATQDLVTKEITFSYGSHWIKLKPIVSINSTNNTELNLTEIKWENKIIKTKEKIETWHNFTQQNNSVFLDFEISSDEPIDFDNETYIYKIQGRNVILDMGWFKEENMYFNNSDISDTHKKFKSKNETDKNKFDPTFTDTSTADFNNGYFRFTTAANGNITLATANFSGQFFSAFFNTNYSSQVVWNNLTWNSSTPNGTNISFSVRVIAPHTADSNTMMLLHFDDNNSADACNLPSGCALLNNTGANIVSGIFVNSTNTSTTSVLIYNISGMNTTITGTWECWLYDDWKTDTGDEIIWSSWGAGAALGNSTELRYTHSTRTWYWYFGNTAGWATARAQENNWNDNEWHHIAYDWNMTALRTNFYIDGTQVGSTTITSGTIPFHSGQLRLGSRLSATGGFDGRFDECRLTNNTFPVNQSHWAPSWRPFTMGEGLYETKANGTDLLLRADNSFNDVNGIAPLVNTSVAFETGYLGNAFNISTTASRLCYDSNLINPNQGTVEMWINRNEDWSTSTVRYFWQYVSNISNPSRDSIGLFAWTDRIVYFEYYNSAGTNNWIGTSALYNWKKGEWHNIAITWNNASSPYLQLFLDGQLINRRTSVMGTISNLGITNNMSIGGGAYLASHQNGCRGVNPTYTANSRLDEITISNYSKSIEELNYWSGKYKTSPQTDLSDLNIADNNYIQYLADLRSNSTTIKPELFDVTISYTTDITSPLIINETIEMIGSNITSGESYNITANITDLNSFTANCIINNSATLNVYPMSLRSGNIYYCTIEGGQIGTWTYAVNATDSYSNTNITNYRTFTINKPSVSITPTYSSIMKLLTIGQISGTINNTDFLRNLTVNITNSNLVFNPSTPQNVSLGSINTSSSTLTNWFLSIVSGLGIHTFIISYTDAYSNNWNTSFNITAQNTFTSPVRTVTVSGTIFSASDTIQWNVGCYDDSNHRVSSTANLSVYYPNSSIWINNQAMSSVTTGAFNYSTANPSYTGSGSVYMVLARCDDTSSNYAESLSEIQITPNWISQITNTNTTIGTITSNQAVINSTVNRIETNTIQINTTSNDIKTNTIQINTTSNDLWNWITQIKNIWLPEINTTTHNTLNNITALNLNGTILQINATTYRIESITTNINGTVNSILLYSQQINASTFKLWEKYQRTNSSVITNRNVINASTQLIAINYTMVVPMKTGYTNNDYLPIKIDYYFLDSNGNCVNNNQADKNVSIYCQSYEVLSLGKINSNTSIYVEIKGNNLNISANYTLFEEVYIDPPVNNEPVWIKYSGEKIATIKGITTVAKSSNMFIYVIIATISSLVLFLVIKRLKKPPVVVSLMILLLSISALGAGYTVNITGVNISIPTPVVVIPMGTYGGSGGSGGMSYSTPVTATVQRLFVDVTYLDSVKKERNTLVKVFTTYNGTSVDPDLIDMAVKTESNITIGKVDTFVKNADGIYEGNIMISEKIPIGLYITETNVLYMNESASETKPLTLIERNFFEWISDNFFQFVTYMFGVI